MSRKFLTNVDMNANQILNLVLQQLGTDPGSPSTGQIWFNTTSHQVKYYTGSATIILYDAASTNTASKLVLRDGSGNFSAGVGTFTGVTISGSVTNSTDAATKAYVDSIAQGLSPKPSATCATTTTIPAYSYSSGVITFTSTGVVTIDTHALALNDYVLVKNETAGNTPNNGLYKVTTAPAIGVAGVLTRAIEMDVSAEFTGSYVFVELGSNASTGWIYTGAAAPTVGTTNITFQQFTGAGDLVFNNPLSASGNTVSLNLNARLVVNSNNLDLASGIVTPGTYTSVTVDTYGRTTAGADIVSGTGVLAKTAASTFTARTITGTTSRIAMTNGDGVSGNPTIDIDAAYVGQTSITTLGTIATGTWSATTIGITKGGTGLTATPTDGQLLIGKTSTNAYVQATLTGTTNQVNVTNGSGTITLATPQNIHSGATPTFAGLTISSGGEAITGVSTYTPTATIASGSTVKWDGLSVPATTATLTGTTTVGTATGFNLVTLYQPTITDASAVTVTNAATLAITNAPTIGGSATITNAYALWVQAGTTYLQGATNFGSSGQMVISSSGVVTSGTWSGTAIAVNKGGTGTASTPTAGQLLIGNNTSGYALATLTQGAGISITNGNGTITIASSGSVIKYSTTITGDGSTTAFTVTHSLNTTAVIANILDSSGNIVEADIQANAVNTIVVTFAVAPTGGGSPTTYTAVVMG